MFFLDLTPINRNGLAYAKPKGVEISHRGVSGARVGGMFQALTRGRKRRLSRSKSRKLFNRRRRWFVDNIIMHHKRLHDKNREIIVNMAKNRVLAKRNQVKSSPTLEKEVTKWREKIDPQTKAQEIKGRIDARRIRARSRWLSIAENKDKN